MAKILKSFEKFWKILKWLKFLEEWAKKCAEIEPKSDWFCFIVDKWYFLAAYTQLFINENNLKF